MINGKNIVVTGASSGIGKSILDKGSKCGLKVVLATKPASTTYAAQSPTPQPTPMAEQPEL